MKYCSAHRAGYVGFRVFLVFGPYFKAISVKTFATSSASRIALSVHLFIANRAHLIFL